MMKKPISLESIVGYLILTIFIYIGWVAHGMSVQAGLFPGSVAAAGIATMSVHLVLKLIRKSVGSNETGHSVDFEITEDEKTNQGLIVTLEQFFWIIGLVSCLWIFGFYVAIPVFLFLYLRRYRESVCLSLALAGTLALIVWLLFGKILLLPFPKPWIFQLIVAG